MNQLQIIPQRNEWQTYGIYILKLKVTLRKWALPEKLIVAQQSRNSPLLMENKDSFRAYKIISVLLSSTKNIASPYKVMSVVLSSTKNIALPYKVMSVVLSSTKNIALPYKVMSVILSSTKNIAFPSSIEPITKSISKMCPQTYRRSNKKLHAPPHSSPPAIHHQALWGSRDPQTIHQP